MANLRYWDTIKEYFAALKGESDAAYVWLKSQIAGERNIGSATASWLLAIPHGNTTRLDIGTTETLVTDSPCIVLTITGNDANTGYSALRDANVTGGGATPQYLLNVGDGVNPQPLFARLENGLTVQGENAAHDVTVVWWPL